MRLGGVSWKTAVSSPLSGATKRYSPTSAAMPRRAEPTPGSTTATNTVPAGKYLKLAASCSAPPSTSCGAMSWVMSTSVRSGQTLNAAAFIDPT